jgi:hypothetical protein
MHHIRNSSNAIPRKSNNPRRIMGVESGGVGVVDGMVDGLMRCWVIGLGFDGGEEARCGWGSGGSREARGALSHGIFFALIALMTRTKTVRAFQRITTVRNEVIRGEASKTSLVLHGIIFRGQLMQGSRFPSQ